MQSVPTSLTKDPDKDFFSKKCYRITKMHRELEFKEYVKFGPSEIFFIS